MFRTTACSLVLAVACAAPAFAEDTAAQAGQDQAASSAAAQASQQQQSDASAQQSSQTDAAAAGEAQLAGARDQADQAMQDPTKMFVMETYNMNLFEIQAGQLAAQRAQDDQVKQFARTMVQDHTKANQQLKQVAQSANVQISEQLDPVHQAKLQKLQKLPASEFGRKYINSQVAGHMMSVLEFQHQSQQGKNDQVKQFATQMLPDLQKHLQHATQLAGQMAGGAGQARTASERQSDDAAATSGDTSSGATGTSGAAGQNASESGGPGQANDASSRDKAQQ